MADVPSEDLTVRSRWSFDDVDRRLTVSIQEVGPSYVVVWVENPGKGRRRRRTVTHAAFRRRATPLSTNAADGGGS